MLTDLLLGLSGVLIGAGVLLLLRDRGTKRGMLPLLLRSGSSTRSLPSTAPDQPDAAAIPPPTPHARVGDPTFVAAGLQVAGTSLPVGRATPANGFSGEAASAEAWARLERTLELAIRATNAAFASAGALLVEREGPRWSETDGGHRAVFAIEHAGREIATLDVLRNRTELVVRSWRYTGAMAPAIRTVTADAMTVTRLAEAVAACAWPCVAQARQRLRL